MRKPTLRSWTIAVVVIAAIGIGWEIAALHTFAGRAGGMRGMIASPRPLDYVNYDYTPNGRHYAFWAFTLPLTATGALLLLAGVAGTAMFVRSGTGKKAFALWACIAACAVVFFGVTACYYLVATNFFI